MHDRFSYAYVNVIEGIRDVNEGCTYDLFLKNEIFSKTRVSNSVIQERRLSKRDLDYRRLFVTKDSVVIFIYYL